MDVDSGHKGLNQIKMIDLFKDIFKPLPTLMKYGKVQINMCY